MAKHKGRRKWRRRLRLALLLVLLLVALLAWSLDRIAPMAKRQALQQALIVCSAEVTRAARQQVLRYADSCSYDTLMHIERDGAGRVTLLAPDTLLLNTIIADTILAVQDSLMEMEKQRISLPLGALTGSWLLSAIGPPLELSFFFQGLPRIQLRDELDDAGINQVRHRIYLDISCELEIIVPFSHLEDTVQCTVLLSEGIIVGYTPDSYVDLGALDETP